MVSQKTPTLKKSASLSDVLKVAKGRAQGIGGAPSNGGVNWDSLNNQLAGAVAYRTNMAALNGVDGGGKPSPIEETKGVLDIVEKLTDITQNGRDPFQTNAALVELRNYIDRQDREALSREIAEVKSSLEKGGGGNPALDTINTLASLGMLGGGESVNPIVEAFGVMKDMGLIGGKPATAPSMTSQMTELVALMAMMKEAFAPQQEASRMHFSDGSVTLSEWLQIEEFKDRRKHQEFERDDAGKRRETGQAAISQLVKALSNAASAIQANPSSPARSADPSSSRSPSALQNGASISQQATAPVMVEVACDYCQAANEVDAVSQPSSFVCVNCDETNNITYNPPTPQPAASLSPLPDIRPPIAWDAEPAIIFAGSNT